MVDKFLLEDYKKDRKEMMQNAYSSIINQNIPIAFDIVLGVNYLDVLNSWESEKQQMDIMLRLKKFPEGWDEGMFIKRILFAEATVTDLLSKLELFFKNKFNKDLRLFVNSEQFKEDRRGIVFA